VRESGSSYLGKNNSDVMLKNRPDPHAFVQLNPMALSKKLRDKAASTFELLMKKKTSGALRGLKISGPKN
jgi:hypothetical protein